MYLVWFGFILFCTKKQKGDTRTNEVDSLQSGVCGGHGSDKRWKQPGMRGGSITLT